MSTARATRPRVVASPAVAPGHEGSAGAVTTEVPGEPVTPSAGDVATPRCGPPGRRLGRNVSALAGSQVVTWCMTLAWTVVVPRALGSSRMGVIVTATSAASIFGVILGMGTKNFLVRELVAVPEEAPGLLGTALVLRVLLVPLFAMSVLVYGHLAHYGHQADIVLYLMTASTVAYLLAEPIQASFQAIERMNYLAYSDMLAKGAQTALGIGVVLLGLGVVGLSVSSVLVAAIVVLVNAYWLRLHTRVDLRTTPRRIRSLLRGSMSYYAFGLFFMIYLWIDTVMLGVMAPTAVVGWYGAATRLFQTLMFVPVILSTAWLPRLVRAFDEGPAELRHEARFPTDLVVVLSLPICFGTAMLAGRALPLLFGSSYAHAGVVMAILGFCVPPMYLNVMLNQVLIAQKRAAIWAWVMAGATVVNPTLNLFLIRFFQGHSHNGAIGAALSLVITEVLIVAVGLAIVGRTVMNFHSTWRLCRALAAAGGMCAVLYLARTEAIWFLVPLGAVTFAALAVVFRVFSSGEVSMLWTGVLGRKLRRRLRPAGHAA